MNPTTDPLAAILIGFFQECDDLLEQLADALGDPGFAATDPDPLNAAFRAVHSIKGGAASFGLDQLSDFAHQLENTFDDLRSGRRRVDPSLILGLQRAADHLGGVVDCARDNRPCGDGAELLNALGAAEIPLRGDWLIGFRPAAALYATGNEPLHILNALLELGEAKVDLSTDDLPCLRDINSHMGYLSWQVRLPGTVPEQLLRDCFDFVEDVCDLTIDRVTKSAMAQIATPTSFRPAMPAAADGATIRVELDRVDRLINIVGELVISQSMLEQTIAPMFFDRHSPARSAFDAFASHVSDLKDAVMAIRAQPVKPLFQRMGRILREAAIAAGKEADLVCVGEMTEVDRSVIDGLTEPLTHMIRNAVDHGLEKPIDRRAAGKPNRGRVTLSAAHRAGRVHIEVSDDGAGIDRARVRSLAIKRGFVRPDQRLGEHEIDDLLFRPGFSTAQAVNTLSGRGVGLDVAREALVRLGGRIAIQSDPGQGTHFSLSLPLSLAVAESMVVRCGGQTLLLPLAAIRETVRIQGADIRRLEDGSALIHIRGQLVSLCDVAQVLGLPLRACPAPRAVAVLVADEDEHQAALVFDEVIDQRQVVIKGLSNNCGTVAGVAAATILGDGRVALILDPGDLIRRAAARSTPTPDLERCPG